MTIEPLFGAATIGGAPGTAETAPEQANPSSTGVSMLDRRPHPERPRRRPFHWCPRSFGKCEVVLCGHHASVLMTQTLDWSVAQFCNKHAREFCGT